MLAELREGINIKFSFYYKIPSIKFFDSCLVSGWLTFVTFYSLIDAVPVPELTTNSYQDRAPPKILLILMKWLCPSPCPKKDFIRDFLEIANMIKRMEKNNNEISSKEPGHFNKF